MKAIIELISQFYSITGNAEVDTILFSIAGFIAFSVAFNIVGVIFDFFEYYDSGLMSNVHWTIRIIVFIGLTWVFKQIFILVNWLCSFQWWIYLIIILLIIILIISISLFKHKLSQKQNRNNIIESTPVTDPLNQVFLSKLSKINQSHNARFFCPRCGHLLVKRVGPYGGFWGCENFPNCRYTRSFR